MKPVRPGAGLSVVLTMLAIGTVAVGTAEPVAAQSVRCGMVLTQSTALASDIGPCPGDGLVIGANNITLNLNGHSVFGTPGPGSGRQAGIRLSRRTGVRVTGQTLAGARRGTVRGFDAGVAIDAGSANTVENLVVRDNIGPNDETVELCDGIVAFHSADNRILNNAVIHNGPCDGIGVLGSGSDRNTLRGNVVRATVGASADSAAGTGIIVNNFLDVADRGRPIFDNRVIGNVVVGNSGSGISNIGSVDGVVSNNNVEDNGLAHFGEIDFLPANGIGAAKGPQLPIPLNLSISRNVVKHNGIFGIIVDRNTDGVTVLENHVTLNGAVGILLFANAHDNKVIRNHTGYNGVLDLLDADDECDNNMWFGNTWGPPTGIFYPTSFYPDCTATGGTQVGSSSPAAASSASQAETDASNRLGFPPDRRPDEAPSRRRPAR